MKAVLAASLILLAAGSSDADAQTVHPSGTTVPENLLRFSIVFEEAPVLPVLPRLMLRRDDGSSVVAPFLEQELWTPDGMTLTVLMHPGRVKTGLNASEELGRALAVGTGVTLLLNGKALKHWRVSNADQSPPDPRRWTVERPRAGSRDMLEVRLDAPVEGLGAHLIAVRAPDGTRLDGSVALQSGETVWTFQPSQPWSEGVYTVVAASLLEDPAGNRPGLPFEHASGAKAETREGPSFAVLPLGVPRRQ